jgi:hypothetical protein
MADTLSRYDAVSLVGGFQNCAVSASNGDMPREEEEARVFTVTKSGKTFFKGRDD